MIDKLKEKKKIGPAACPCNINGFLCEISRVIREAGNKWDKCWNSANFKEEAEAIKFLAEDMLVCVDAAIEKGSKDIQNHQK